MGGGEEMKVLKLINNERKQVYVNSKKGCTDDVCYINDTAFCDIGSSDICKADRASCGNGINDTCKTNFIDWIGCSSPLDTPYN